MKRFLSLSLATALLLGVQPTNNAQDVGAMSGEYHDNVVIVLDASGSMKQNMRGTKIRKMNAAKDALKAVLQNVPSSTHIGLLVFSAGNLKNHWAYPLGARDEAKLMSAIDRPKANRGTPLGEYIKIGADRLLEAREEQYGYGTYRLLIVTDGDANDPELVDRYAPQILARGITMDVIGVDMQTDHTLATMAHSYRRANDPASLEQAIREVFAEVSTDGGDFSMDEAFQYLAPLPIETATAALTALATSGNDPIGAKAARRQATPVRAQKTAVPSNNVVVHDTVFVEKKSSSLVKIGLVGLIILAVLIKKLTS